MTTRLNDVVAPWSGAPKRVRCLNCDAELSGPFCGQCGQRDVPPYPSVRELAIDAVSEFSGWDGRLFATVRAVLLRPGFLTLEFLEGRRARYISPLRLYLSASVIYFLLNAAAPNITLNNGRSLSGLGFEVKKTTASSTAAQGAAEAENDAMGRGTPMTEAEKRTALNDIKRAPGLMQPFLRRVLIDPNGFERGMAETLPKMLFVLLPVFAGIVALFFRHRKYPEHLYFAIHLHTFVFLALCFTLISKFPGWAPLAVVTSIAVIVWIPVYASQAFRRVYGGSVAAILFKEVGIAVIYAVLSVVALILTLYWVSIAA